MVIFFVKPLENIPNFCFRSVTILPLQMHHRAKINCKLGKFLSHLGPCKVRMYFFPVLDL